MNEFAGKNPWVVFFSWLPPLVALMWKILVWAYEKILPGLWEKLKEIKKALASSENWKEENIRRVLPDKKIFPLLRIKLTGRKKGPELPKVIFLLGKEAALKRLE